MFQTSNMGCSVGKPATAKENQLERAESLPAVFFTVVASRRRSQEMGTETSASRPASIWAR
jgi:hypothetical protein